MLLERVVLDNFDFPSEYSSFCQRGLQMILHPGDNLQIVRVILGLSVLKGER